MTEHFVVACRKLQYENDPTHLTQFFRENVYKPGIAGFSLQIIRDFNADELVRYQGLILFRECMLQQFGQWAIEQKRELFKTLLTL